jgi:hypothetical protein
VRSLFLHTPEAVPKTIRLGLHPGLLVNLTFPPLRFISPYRTKPFQSRTLYRRFHPPVLLCLVDAPLKMLPCTSRRREGGITGFSQIPRKYKIDMLTQYSTRIPSSSHLNPYFDHFFRQCSLSHEIPHLSSCVTEHISSTCQGSVLSFHGT